MGSKPEEVAMIGVDTKSDVAGALTVGVGPGILGRKGTGAWRRIQFSTMPAAVASDMRAAVDLALCRSIKHWSYSLYGPRSGTSGHSVGARRMTALSRCR